MVDGNYVGEIRIISSGEPPQGWALCDGRVMQIQSNTALYSLLGNRYGGDGQTTFCLPDLRSRLPIGMDETLATGSIGGEETVTLKAEHMAPHSHVIQAVDAPANTPNPGNNFIARSANLDIFTDAEPTKKMNHSMIGLGGQAEPKSHPNLQPALAVNFIIALQGVYPNRT